jgi:hypothetical protein
MEAWVVMFAQPSQLIVKDTIMPARLLGVIGFVLILLGCVSQVSADFCFGMFNGMAKDVKRRQCWPEPFASADRVAARAPFVTMVSNGWRRQNMLGENHFDPATGQLTEAGRQKVRWILVTGPQQHRTIYVHAGQTEEETSARMAVVQQLACQITPNNPPPVFSTTIADAGWPATEVNAISRKYIGSLPNPRLPAPSSSSGSSGGAAPSGN